MLTSTTIRKSINGLLLMAFLLSGTASCKKEKDNKPEPTPPPPVAQRIKEFKAGDEMMRFDYNAAGNVSKVTINSDIKTGGVDMSFAVSYDGGRIASLETNGEKIVPLYENNQLARADFFEANQKVGYTNYHFENGLLKRATLYFGEDGDYQPVLEFNFAHNAAGNITEMVTMTAGDEPGQMVRAGHVSYQYDQKTNPLYHQRDLLAMFWQTASKNNIKEEDHFDSDLQPEDKLVYNYQYNGNGLPKSAVVTQGLPGQPTATSNLSFVYQ